MFEYKWHPLKLPEIFCNNIVTASVAIGDLEQQLPKITEVLAVKEGSSFLIHVDFILDNLEIIVFSASSLVYQEETQLIDFGKRVEKAIGWIMRRIKRDKRALSKDQEKLKLLKSDMKRKRKRLESAVEKDAAAVAADSALYEEYAKVLVETVEHFEQATETVHDLNQAGKAQQRETLSPAYLKERVSTRTNFGLVRVIKRDAIEIDQALKGIASRYKELRKALSKKQPLDDVTEKRLFKLFEIEDKDVKEIFDNTLTVKTRLQSQFHKLGKLIATGKLPQLAERHHRVHDHFEELAKDIRTQQKRLRNEFESEDIKKPDVEMAA